MALDKYSIQHKSVDNLLNLIDMGQIAIPEIQRPFIWQTTKVRDFMDSLYRGFPVGYIITWKNPNIRLKDGTSSNGKTILIDGQQRVTALKAALDGQQVVNKNYESKRIRIAFHPIKEQFETSTPAIEKDKEWISDISVVMKKNFDTFSFIEEYAKINPDTDKNILNQRITDLLQIKTRTIGELEIKSQLEIEVVNEIFVRINSKGTPLSEADFAMSRIAVYEMTSGDKFGMRLRKHFDYFCNLLRAPETIKLMKENDVSFSTTEQFEQIKWVAKEPELIYKPLYSDIIRVAGIIGLNRATMRDVVALLAGRNFEVRSFNREDSYLAEIAEDSFIKFEAAIKKIVNEYNYKRFEQDILRGSGFNNSDMFNSTNLLNFTFAVFQKVILLSSDYGLIKKITRKLLIFSILTAHHSGSFESKWNADFKYFTSIEKVSELLNNYEEEQLNDIFWSVTLPRELDKVANIKTPEWNLFVAAQNKLGKQSFLSQILVRDMKIDDLHHIFPQEFMKENNKDKNDYNRIANFVILSRDINIKIGKTPPEIYFKEIKQFGSDVENLSENLAQNCIPNNQELVKVENYNTFMIERNKLIAKLIKDYYFSL